MSIARAVQNRARLLIFLAKHIAQLIADDPTKLHCCVTSGPGAKDLCFATADETLLSLHEGTRYTLAHHELNPSSSLGEWLEEGTLPRRYASIVTCIPEMVRCRSSDIACSPTRSGNHTRATLVKIKLRR